VRREKERSNVVERPWREDGPKALLIVTFQDTSLKRPETYRTVEKTVSKDSKRGLVAFRRPGGISEGARSSIIVNPLAHRPSKCGRSESAFSLERCS